ncbi:MAG: methyl-accepting chemotaxis protein [Actinomycetota bacterium]
MNMTVKARIWGGFILVLGFLALVAGIGLHSLGSVADGVADYARISNISLSVEGINADTLRMRVALLNYNARPSAKTYENLMAARKEARRQIEEFVSLSHSPVRKAMAAELTGILGQYEAKVDEIVAMRNRMGLTSEDGLQGEFRKSVHAIEDRLKAANDVRTANVLLTMRRNEKDFQLRLDRKYADAVDKGATELKAAIVASGLSPDAKVQADQAIAEYLDRFHEMVEMQTKLDLYLRETLPAIGEHFAARVDDLLESQKGNNPAPEHLKGSQKVGQATIESEISSAKTQETLLSVLAFALGLGFAFLIARSIINPVHAMTGAMRRLAGGQLDVEVPALANQDEIGEMAQAVQVFKQNAIDKLRMEAEQRAAEEAARKAEEDLRTREAAIVAEVAQVAKAASEGELDRRIDLAGKDGFLLTLCDGINGLVETTGKALADVASVLESVAGGDLTRRITAEYGGVFNRLKTDVNRTADKLSEIVTDINSAAAQIGSAASEVASGSQDLSERSEQQASSLEETAASMEELAATVRQNSANAQQANQLAAGAREVAASGGQVVADAVEAMERIETSSQKIGDIVGMIDEIAFQTNLLALNAAVEAARAGDAGKGFAVVAQEVRNLAQRSAQASKEIKGLIAESTTQVATGADLVKGAGRTLDEILGSVKRVADIVAEIAAASQEQASGIDQVNGAITQMDEMTQQNAALVEQSTAAAHALEEQSRELGRLMAFFQLSGARDRVREPA